MKDLKYFRHTGGTKRDQCCINRIIELLRRGNQECHQRAAVSGTASDGAKGGREESTAGGGAQALLYFSRISDWKALKQ